MTRKTRKKSAKNTKILKTRQTSGINMPGFFATSCQRRKS